MTKRRIAITAAAVILVVGVVAGREKPSLEIIEPRAAAQADDGIDLDRLRRGEGAAPQNDPFAKKDFTPERRAAAAPPAKPVAPALPFQYFGKVTENGKTEVYLMRGDELLSIAPGQKLGEYRVDKIDEASIAFTYLPLKTKQTLDFQ